ncbi:DUF1583 domain-containing protein, partial [bacterium]|nr:DUF1583 domain-containing protein [bacterium]
AQKVPGAETLLLLAQIADARPDVETLKTSLAARAATMKASIPADRKYAGSVDANSLAIAAAALKHRELRAIAEQMFDLLVESTLGGSSPRVRPFLRVAQATAIQLNRGESGPEVLRQNRLKYWIPVSGVTSKSSAAGSVPTMWLTHEDHILHLAGAGQDGLLFRYPLSGEFNFLCETQEGGDIGTDGGLSFGGLYFEALGINSQLTVQDADAAFSLKRPCPFVRHESHPVFNRVSIRTRPAADGKPAAAQFLANLHPMWTDELSESSPWLGLRGVDEKRPIFRNLKLTGTPVIPREVQLAADHQLRGWLSNFYGETQPAFHAGGTLSIQTGTISATRPETPSVGAGDSTGATTTQLDTDWQITDGVITAAKRAPQQGRTSQSVLRYQRPLLDGESVSYEFEYQPGEFEVHPALGRLALLIETGGVRIHWMTDGNHEWSGLPEDNATLEPLSRRGGRSIPLKEGDWNAVTLARADGKLKLTLNGTLIYEREIDFGGDLQFGLYRDRTRHAVKVRNVKLTGDWPEAVPADCLENPTIVTDEPAAAADRKVSQTTIGDTFLAENVTAVRAAAARLTTPAERFEFLSRWVLPQSERATFRTTAAFTPVDPPPAEVLGAVGVEQPVIQRPLRDQTAQEPLNHQRELDGGNESSRAQMSRNSGASRLVSPVFDLLDIARELGRLDELKAAIEAAPQTSHPQNERDRAALLTLVNLELGDQAAANQSIDRLRELLPVTPPPALSERWPETLVVYRAITRSEPPESAGELLVTIYESWVLRPSPPELEAWQSHVVALLGRHQRAVVTSDGDSTGSPLDLADWVLAVRQRARTRGPGNAEALWQRNEQNEVHHVAGHQEETLLYRSPLRGNFEVSCEIGAYGTTQVQAAGFFTAPGSNLSTLDVGTFRRGTISRGPVDPPFGRVNHWLQYLASFRDGHCTVSINGRVVRSEQLPADADPWFGIHAWYRNTARFRDVRISGNPAIPDAVLLSADPQLDGWLPYYDESVGYGSARWRLETDPESRAGGVLIGQHDGNLSGTSCESLLAYQRPLSENGTIDYEFFYEPERLETHPALDRVAFLLRPEGVRLHWITDGIYDATGLSPDNEFGGSTTRLPLQPGAWNRLRLRLAGERITITLNGQDVFEAALNPGNRRTFGLFHFADQSEVRVRDVVMHGDWPRSVPPVTQQPLADQTILALDAQRSRLTAVFEHNFGTNGIPRDYFEWRDPKGGAQIQQRPDGVKVVRPAFGSWTGTDLIARFVLRGDFDVEAQFDEFEYRGDKDAAMMLIVKLDDEAQHFCRALRNSVENHRRQVYQVSRSLVNTDGSRSYHSVPVACEANAGRLRLARRGDTVFYLFAEADSPNYRLFGQDRFSAVDSILGGVELAANANGTATVGVLWKRLRIAAEKLLILPDPDLKPTNEIFVMNADGSNLRSVTGHDKSLGGAGSPDWSPDGKQIAFDIYSGGRTGNYLINVDGTGMKYLGDGCMPTFGSAGDRLAFTWSGRGMALMDIDGTNRQVLTSDGWGAQFSPDGKSVAYQSYEQTAQGRSTNISIIDVATKKKRVILEGDPAQRYSSIYWNMEWSPDSRQICFKGRLRNQAESYEVAITSIDGSPKGFGVLTTETTDTDFGWHPDGSRILLAKTSPKFRGGPRLFVCDLKTGAIDLLTGQPIDMPNHSGVWSPDGKQIAFVSRRNPEPIPFRQVAASSGRTSSSLLPQTAPLTR